jgi:hypothetical protein
MAISNSSNADPGVSSVANATLSRSFNMSAEQKLSINGWFGFSMTTSICSSFLILLLLVSMLHHKAKYEGSRILIIHLMMMQLLICGVHFPILIITSYMAMMQKKFNLNCSAFLLFHIGSMHAENWASAFLAVNRYVAIALPHHYKKLVSKKSVAAMIVLPWMIGFGDTLPPYFGVGANFLLAPPHGACTTRTNGGVYGTIWIVIGAYIPMAVMGFVYVTLFVRLALARCNN